MDEEHIFHSDLPEVKEFPSGNFMTQVMKEWHKWDQLTAIVCGYTEKALTYKELRQQVEKWCGYFSAKYPKQTIIGMITPNTVEACICIMGMMAAGMIYLGINEHGSIDEISSRLTTLSIRDVIIHKPHKKRVEEALTRIGGKFTKIFIGCDSSPMENEVTFLDVLNDESITSAKPVDIDGENILNVVYTSGSTGHPKPTTLSHRSFTTALEIIVQMNRLSPKKDGIEVGFVHRYLNHVYGLFSMLLMGLKFGYKLWVKNYEDDKLIEDLDRFKITQLLIVPAMLKTLFKIPNERPQVLDHLKSVSSSAAPLPDSLVKQFFEKLPGVTFTQGLGMTEVMFLAATMLTKDQPANMFKTTCNVKLKIIDMETGKSLPVNRRGEIVCKTPTLFTEYLFNPEATAKSKTADGWYRTGDVGMVDDKNYLHLFDRIKQIIKPGMLQPVYPAEIEDVLMSHPGVASACVVGIPHPEYLEAPRAFVVLEDLSVTTDALHKLVADKLPANNKLTGGIIFLDALPYISAGKVDKLSLAKKV